jgi:opacity protein-like surface antigen
MKRIVLVATCLALPLASSARADRRAYGVTYEAVTAPQGELDVETWSTFAPRGEVDGGPSSRGIREMIELEYGITDRWDVALYNMLDMITAGDTESGYAGFKVETRYRPSDRGEWPLDPVLYLEVQQLFRGDARQKAEAKLILAKDLGNVNLAANLALEEERTTEPAWNTEVEYAAGASYAVTPAWMVGAELFGKAERGEMGGIENRSWAGPALSWAGGGRGALRGVWVTLAGGAGLGGAADPYYARAIVGFQFR